MIGKLLIQIKPAIIMLLCSILLLFSGCVKHTEKEMYIEVANLNEKE